MTVIKKISACVLVLSLLLVSSACTGDLPDNGEQSNATYEPLGFADLSGVIPDGYTVSQLILPSPNELLVLCQRVGDSGNRFIVRLCDTVTGDVKSEGSFDVPLDMVGDYNAPIVDIVMSSANKGSLCISTDLGVFWIADDYRELDSAKMIDCSEAVRSFIGCDYVLLPSASFEGAYLACEGSLYYCDFGTGKDGCIASNLYDDNMRLHCLSSDGRFLMFSCNDDYGAYTSIYDVGTGKMYRSDSRGEPEFCLENSFVTNDYLNSCFYVFSLDSSRSSLRITPVESGEFCVGRTDDCIVTRCTNEDNSTLRVYGLQDGCIKYSTSLSAFTGNVAVCEGRVAHVEYIESDSDSDDGYSITEKLYADDLALPSEEETLGVAFECKNATAAEDCAQTVSRIKEEMGVTVLYGDEIQDGYPDFYAKPCNVDFLLADYLEQVERILSEFPKGFFDKICPEQCSSIEIHVSSTITGTSFNGTNYPVGFTVEDNGKKIIVVNGGEGRSADSVLPHEIMHIIDSKLTEMYFNGADELENYVNWESNFPEYVSFAYSYIDENGDDYYDNTYVFGSDRGEVFFIDAYSKTFPGEDKCRIFEGLFNGELSSSDAVYLTDGHIHDRARVICKAIRLLIGNDNTEAYVWERALTVGAAVGQ